MSWMQEYRDLIPHRSPCGADPFGLKILEEAKEGKLDTILRELDTSFRGEGKWDQRAFYVSLAADNLKGKEAMLVETRHPARATQDKSCVRSFSNFLRSLFGMSRRQSPQEGEPEHRIVLLQQDPEIPNDTALGKLIEGEWLIRRAWDARGSGTADTVSDQAHDIFTERLLKARDSLLQAANLDNEDPTPYAFLQTVAKGLPQRFVPRETANYWLDQALERDILNRPARLRHLSLLCKKWGGSHEEMYSFARECIKASPAGSSLKTLLFQAFYEHHMYLKYFILGRDAMVQQKIRETGNGQLLASWQKKKAETEKELKDLLESSREETMQIYNEVLANTKIGNVAQYPPHHDAFLWFHARGDKELARKVFDKMSPYFPQM